MTITSKTSASLALKSLGLIPYADALTGQRKIHAEVADGSRTNTLILLEHPSVYTAGRRTTVDERPVDGTPVVDVDRGGKITYHGPGQLVGEVESTLIEVCKEFGIAAERYCERSGVWLRDEKGDRKIAAIGIRVAQGVTMHGFALNVAPDLLAFDRIIPCGFTDTGVTSMAVELGRSITIAEVAPVLEKHMFEALNRVSA